MPSIVFCGPDDDRNGEVIKTLRQKCWKTLQNHRYICNVQRNVLSSQGITQRSHFQCRDLVYEKVLTDIVVNQCIKENADPSVDFITDNCIIKYMTFAEKCLNDTSAVDRIVESDSVVGKTLQGYKSMLIVLIGPRQIEFDDGIWLKLNKESLKEILQEHKYLLDSYMIPYMDLTHADTTEICDVLSNAIKGTIRRDTCSLVYYEQVAKTEKNGGRLKSAQTSFQKNFIFFRRLPTKTENVYIPTIKILEHTYELDWTDFPRDRTNRFIQRHGHENIVCMAFHINLRFSQVHKILMNGIRVNGELYSFLGCSSSGLKSRKCYMWKGSANDVREILQSNGDFDSIKTVSKRLSRIGLLFSSVAQTTVKIEDDNVLRIDDITDGDHNFSDGCGLVGTKVARNIFNQVKENIEQHDIPSVFQVRFQGFKGVLALSNTLEESKIAVRPSMEKFHTTQHPFIGVCNFSKPYTFGHLNKQFIQLLSGLGVPDTSFIDKQTDHFKMITNMLTHSDTSVECLQWRNEHETAKRIASAGGLCKLPEKDKQEIMKVLKKLQQQLVSKLQKLTIMVPMSRNVFGICDTSNSLEYGECFVRLTISGKPKSLQGQVVVCKNPCYLLGDIRVLTAVDVPELNHLKDCIVFPSKGKRPHADEIAGSDLDGDEYFVCWDKTLIPKEIRPPYDYPPAKAISHGNITEENVIAYFAKQNETMKMIGKVNKFYNKWADLKNVTSTQCERLGQLFSRVIDSGKSGEEVDIPRELKPPENESVSKYVWNVMEVNAVRFESNFTKDLILREPVEDISSDFVQNLVSKTYSNISEYDKFMFCWKYSMNIHESQETVIKDVMESYAGKINFSLMSVDERKDVIEKGIPRKYVMNALNKSNILTEEDLKRFQMDIPQNSWGEYLALSYEAFDWTHLFKTLCQNDCNLVVLQMPDNVIIELQFLGKLTKGIEQPVEPGTISAILYSKNFGKTCRYILGAEYVLDFNEDTLQLYREGKKNLTFVWLKATDRKATKGRWNKTVSDEVVNSISVDLQRFDRRILQSNRHPLVNKTPFIRLEIYAQNDKDAEYPYWDVFDANDILPVEEVPEKETEDEEAFNVDFDRLFPSEEISVVPDSGSDFSNAERNPYAFKVLLNSTVGENLPEQIGFHFVNLLNHITARVFPMTLPNDLQSVLVEILSLLSGCLTSPQEVFTVAAHLERLGLDDVAKQISQKGYEESTISIGCFLETLENWQNLWFTDAATAHFILKMLSVTEHSPIQWSHGAKMVIRRQMYIHRLGIMHANAFLEEVDNCKNCLTQTKPESKVKGSQTSVLYLRAIQNSDEPKTISFYRTQALDGSIRFSQGQCVSIQRQSKPGTTLLLGQIHNLRLAPFQMTLKIESEVPESVLPEIQSEGVRYFRADLVGNIVTYQRVTTALKRLNELKTESPILDFVAGSLNTTERDLADAETILSETCIQKNTEFLEFMDLNENQRQAVSAAMLNSMCLIQGPPGTGKTKVACHIVKQIMFTKRYKGMLIIAETNNAVDNLARRLRNDLQVVRIGAYEAVAKDLYDITLEEQVKQIADKEAKRTKRRDQHGDLHRDTALIKKVLSAADVVLSTCSGAGDVILESFPFEFVLVDEATMTLETTLLCSLVHGVKHLVMIGDDKQLGPPITVSNKDYVHLGLPSPTELSQTLFHRLIENQSTPTCFLDTQHRMHPEIMRFPSEEFYDGKLRAAGFLGTRDDVKFPWPQKEPYKPICFVNVDGRETRRGTSYCNKSEVEVVKKIIEVLLTVDEESFREFRLAVTDIAVLTLYQAQVIELKGKINKGIVVSSVDGFQGQEKEAIVVSTVRCNNRQSVGFSGDSQRINVLLTRAKRGLIVVGNGETLKASDVWRKWLLQAPVLSESEIKPVKPGEKARDGSEQTGSKRSPRKSGHASGKNQK